MANPTGKNSPEQFGGFGQHAPYGAKKQAAALQKAAPMAGQGAANQAIGTPRRASQLGIKAAQRNQQAMQQALPQPPAPQPQAPMVPQVGQAVQPDVTADVWRQVASDPGASPLVRAYAASVT